MEESSEQILSHLAVIHRFMAMHTMGQDDLTASNMNIGPGELQRIRTVSISDNEAGSGGAGSGGTGGGGGGSSGGGLMAPASQSLQVRSNNADRFTKVSHNIHYPLPIVGN